MKRHLSMLLAAVMLCVVGVGVWLSAKTPADADVLGADDLGMMMIEDEDGLYILAVREGSTADHCGIQPGDLLFMMEDMAVREVEDIDLIMADSGASRGLDCMVLRKGELCPIRLKWQLQGRR